MKEKYTLYLNKQDYFIHEMYYNMFLKTIIQFDTMILK